MRFRGFEFRGFEFRGLEFRDLECRGLRFRGLVFRLGVHNYHRGSGLSWVILSQLYWSWVVSTRQRKVQRLTSNPMSCKSKVS